MSLRPVVLLALPLLVAACGGGSDGESRTTTAEAPRLTMQELVSEANRVCIASDRRVFRLGQLSTDPDGWRRTARAAARGVADMEKLRPPEAQEAGFEAMLVSARGLQRAIADVAQALEKHELPKARAAQVRATRLDTKIKRQASKLGLTFCEQLLTNWPA